MKKKNKKNHIPQEHAEVAKAFAEGAEIEFFFESGGYWMSTTRPIWDDKVQFRIKPSAPPASGVGPKATGPDQYDTLVDSYQKALDKLDEEEMKSLLLTLLMKRAVDGGGRRRWDASEHLKWEGRVQFLMGNLHAFAELKEGQ